MSDRDPHWDRLRRLARNSDFNARPADLKRAVSDLKDDVYLLSLFVGGDSDAGRAIGGVERLLIDLLAQMRKRAAAR